MITADRIEKLMDKLWEQPRQLIVHPSDPRAAYVPRHQHPLRPGDFMDPSCLHCKVITR